MPTLEYSTRKSRSGSLTTQTDEPFDSYCCTLRAQPYSTSNEASSCIEKELALLLKVIKSTAMTRTNLAIKERRVVQKTRTNKQREGSVRSTSVKKPGSLLMVDRAVSENLDKKNLNVSADGTFYEKAASRRVRHRAALLRSKSADEAVPLAALGRRAAEPWRPRRSTSVLVAPEFKEDPNLQAIKGKPVSFQGKYQLVAKVQQRAIHKMGGGRPGRTNVFQGIHRKETVSATNDALEN